MARNGSFAVEKLRIEFQRLEQVGRLTPVLDVLKARDTPKLKDVTKCYRRLAAQIHPDKGGRGDKQRATSAFQVLTRAHDQALHAALFDALKLEENLNTGKMQVQGSGIVDKEFRVPIYLLYSEQNTQDEDDIESFELQEDEEAVAAEAAAEAAEAEEVAAAAASAAAGAGKFDDGGEESEDEYDLEFSRDREK